jgi:hypothetical protein
LLYRFETRAKLRELGHFLFVGPKVKARREPPGEADPDS